MPRPLASLAVTAGQTYTVSVGSRGTVGAVVIANESPYGLQVSTGSGGLWIVAQTADLVPCDSTAFSGNLTITTDNYLSNAASAPSFLVYMTVYAPGEAIRGTYPAPLMRLASGITSLVNSPATTIERDLLTPFVYTGLIATADGSVANQLDVTSGIAYPQQSDGSLLRQAPAAAAWLTSVPSATYFLDLNPDGSWSWGTAHSTQSNYLAIAQVTTNGSGNISAVTDKRPLNTTMLSQMAGNLIWNMVTFLTAARGGPVVMQVNGEMSAAAPVVLEAGIQETGGCGRIYVASAANQSDGIVVPFRCQMTNVPTSVTLTPTSSGNVKAGTPTATNITQDSFLLFLEAAAAGTVTWQGTYTTVGN